jgi:hypothetical protein
MSGFSGLEVTCCDLLKASASRMKSKVIGMERERVI